MTNSLANHTLSGRVWSIAYTNLVLSSRIWKSILDVYSFMEWAWFNVGGLKYSAQEQNEIGMAVDQGTADKQPEIGLTLGGSHVSTCLEDKMASLMLQNVNMRLYMSASSPSSPEHR
jgi:hypothetical protein